MVFQRRSVWQFKIGSHNSQKSNTVRFMAKFYFSILLIKSVPCNYISRTCIVSLLLIGLCHIHIEAKLLVPVSLLKPTLILIVIFILFFKPN